MKPGLRDFHLWLLNLTGDIAQLGERRPCKAEVTGSNPVISTRSERLFFEN